MPGRRWRTRPSWPTPTFGLLLPLEAHDSLYSCGAGRSRRRHECAVSGNVRPSHLHPRFQWTTPSANGHAANESSTVVASPDRSMFVSRAPAGHRSVDCDSRNGHRDVDIRAGGGPRRVELGSSITALVMTGRFDGVIEFWKPDWPTHQVAHCLGRCRSGRCCAETDNWRSPSSPASNSDCSVWSWPIPTLVGGCGRAKRWRRKRLFRLQGRASRSSPSGWASACTTRCAGAT